VKRYKNSVLVDWHSAGGDHPEWFYDDGLHLRPDGATAYAQLVAAKAF
jgi:lysophospholipase L1-like esterase